jgi:hypothetical protein
MVIGLVIYFLYGVHNSVLGAGKPIKDEGLVAEAPLT